MPAGTFALPTK
jgi:hypothetical protein